MRLDILRFTAINCDFYSLFLLQIASDTSFFAVRRGKQAVYRKKFAS